jgi:hypothetical protein
MLQVVRKTKHCFQYESSLNMKVHMIRSTNGSYHSFIIPCNRHSKKRDFYFRALGSLVVLSFPQPLSFFLVSPSPCLKTAEEAHTGGFPFS